VSSGGEAKGDEGRGESGECSGGGYEARKAGEGSKVRWRYGRGLWDVSAGSADEADGLVGGGTDRHQQASLPVTDQERALGKVLMAGLACRG
jgi:hypothetical protein